MLNSQVCSNLGFVLTVGIHEAQADLIFRDIPTPPVPAAEGEEVLLSRVESSSLW